MNEIKRQSKRSTTRFIITFLICVFSLLTFACTGAHNKETSAMKNVTDQVAKNDDSDAGKTGDDQKIVCRTRAATGSHFKNKVCATKAEWAIRDKKNREELESLKRDVNKNSNINAGTGSDAMGGMSGGMTR